jgi:hypothetical protein
MCNVAIWRFPQGLFFCLACWFLFLHVVYRVS